MRKYIFFFALSLALAAVVPLSTYAGFFNTEYVIGSPIWSEDTLPDTWVFFGGCENYDNQACQAADYDGLIIGDYNVKQGAYGLSVPNDEHVHGKLFLHYSYRFTSEEGDDNTTDVGYIKVKDVETDTIYYLKTLTAKDQSDDWTEVRQVFSADLVNRPLQLVTEVQNDDERLSTMAIKDIFLNISPSQLFVGQSMN